MSRSHEQAPVLPELLSQLGEGVSEELHLAEVVITLRDPLSGETHQFVRSRQRLGRHPQAGIGSAARAIVSRSIEFRQSIIGRIEFHASERTRANQLFAAAQDLAERPTHCISRAAVMTP